MTTLDSWQGLTNFVIPSDGLWHDVPGAIITVDPAIAFTLEAEAQWGLDQGSAAQGANVQISLQVIDAAVAANQYLFALAGFQFAGAAGGGKHLWGVLAKKNDVDPLAAAVSFKLQASVTTLTGLGACGFYPGTFNGNAPIRLAAVDHS